MNILDKPQNLVPRSVTSGPLPGSKKIYHHPRGRADIAVPFREIALDPSAGEPPVRVYDPSGPYTQDAVSIDLSKGLAPVREPWLAARQGLDTYAGRAVRPEDNGGAAPGRLVPPCPAN
ncbi:MAG: phosphomethylpyrimidine synthase ThiC, partial [Methylocella sp.]